MINGFMTIVEIEQSQRVSSLLKGPEVVSNEVVLLK